MRVGLLGPVDLTVDGASVPLGGVQQRAVLAMLALRPGRVVAVDRLVDGIWGDEPPASVANAVQVRIAGLRKATGGLPGFSLVTRPPGYVLEVDPEVVDVVRFAALRRDAAAAMSHQSHDAALQAYDQALALWRGEALSDVRSAPFAGPEATALAELRVATAEARFGAALALGGHQTLVPELELFVSEQPYREGAWEALLVALYRCGRSADALAAYRRYRELLGDELGIEPGRGLQEIHQRILRQDQALDLPVREPPGLEASMTVLRSGLLAGPCQLVWPDGTATDVPPGEVVLGRHSTNGVVVADPRVSRRHAVLRPTIAGMVVEDLGSSNGTLLNGRPLRTSMFLADGDTIDLGGVVLTYRTVVG